MSPEDALALKVSTDISDENYQKLRNACKKLCNADIFPTLHEIREAKLKCYPEDLAISEVSASSSVQNLLDHTVSRILETTDLEKFFQNSSSHIGTCRIKAGFDGASSQSIYCQKYEVVDADEAIKNEETLLQTAIAPLNITFGDITLWKNKTPNSAKFCRPLKLEFAKETKEISINEEDLIKKQISELNPYSFELNGSKFLINFDIELTMLDGKAINALTGTKSTNVCNVCNAKPSEMNNLELIRKKDVNLKNLKYGLSTLHCWIRTFEFLLHISYKIPTKSYYSRSQDAKDSVNAQKNKVRSEFRSRANLHVDMPKQGSGNSNCGNTARTAFADSKMFSMVTGIGEDLIIRLRVILKAISCGTELNIQNFKEYCWKTSEILVQNFPWYNIPPTVHKMLEHGYLIAEELELPLGFYSEECLEAQHKDVRNARLNHTSKISRLNTMKNMYHHLLIKTDPVINSTIFARKKMYDVNDFGDDSDLINLLVFE